MGIVGIDLLFPYVYLEGALSKGEIYLFFNKKR